MARNRMSLDEAMEKYKGQGGGTEYFSLKDDKDTAVVRFMHEDISEDWHVVHKAKIGGKDRWVLCSQEGDCPICVSGNKPQLKLFLQLIQDGKRKLWERGQTFIATIQGMINKYGDLCNRKYEIERQGKAGSTDTKYALYPMDKDNWTVDDVCDEFKTERQELVGPNNFILELEYSDMKKVANGTFELKRDDRDDDRGRGRGRDDRDDRRSNRDDRDDRDDRRRDRDDDRRERDRDHDRNDERRRSRDDRDEDDRRESRRNSDENEGRRGRDRNDDNRGRGERESDRGERRSGRGGSDVF